MLPTRITLKFAPRELLCLLLPIAMTPVFARTYSLDLNVDLPVVQRGQLDLGGTGPNGQSVEVNSLYIEENGRPFMPVVGEFHYSRVPNAEWEEELRKMKAGGINTVATYVFWNLHERTPDHFDWSGDLDLRRFVELTRKVGLQMVLRVGPFDHGEIRNGGLPDWIYGQPYEVRSNDAGYLARVEKLYSAISDQVKGLLYKEGGPIVAIQLENEFQHSAAPWEIRYAGSPKEFTVASRDVAVTHNGVSVSAVANQNSGYGSDHMVNLKRIAKKYGLDAPLYTATGWGNAAIVAKGSLPVTAAYPYPFWTPKPEPSPLYLFKEIKLHPDYAPVSFDPALYPSLPAELGAGMSLTYSRRAYVPEESVEPLIIRVLGSGSNGIGYYMYHGGATPQFDKFYNEDASGLPKINYDYQAPLGQYGRAKAHYFSLRLLHLFLASYGEQLAPLGTVLPATNAEISPSDTSTLRYAARAAKGSGFIFLNNYQDHVAMQDLSDLVLKLKSSDGEISIPSEGSFTLKRDVSAILPVNIKLGANTLRSATVQPLSILRSAGVSRFIFFSIDGFPPELVFDKGHVTNQENCHVESSNGAVVVRGETGRVFSFELDGAPVLVVPRKLALQAVDLGDGRMMFADATVTLNESRATILMSGGTQVDVLLYPASKRELRVTGAKETRLDSPSPVISATRLQFMPVTYTATWRQITPRRYGLKITAPLGSLHDVFMRVNYIGDTGMAFFDGRMIDDHFYSGRPWEIGLKRFLPEVEGKEIVFVLQSLKRDATYWNDIPESFRPTFAPGENEYLDVRGVDFIPEYSAEIDLSTTR
jgi:hypothetical protein